MSSKKKLLAIASIGLAMVVAMSGCTATPEEGSGGGSATSAPLLRIGSLNEPTSWDPGQANEGHFAPLYQAVYDTLIKREPDGSLSPMLATEWEFSEDMLSFTMTLRDDVTFTDGTAFDSSVVKANLEHFKAANGPRASVLNEVTEVETPDATTVVVRLSDPNPDLPYVLANASGYMGSAAALGSDEIVTEPVGSGPYVLDVSTTVVGSKLSFVRNEDYWGEKLPYDRVEFSIMVDETARLNALKSGQIDAAVFQRTATAAEAEQAGLRHEPYATNWEGIWFFDRTGEITPELADVRVRKALALAIDRDAVLETVQFGKGELSSQVFGPEALGFNEAYEDAYAYDPAEAKKLLAAAGVTNLTLTLPISPAWDPAIYDAIIQNWQDIGVTVNRHEWGPGEAIPSLLRGEFGVAYMSLARGTGWLQVAQLIAPTGSWNPLHTQTAELDGYIHDLQFAREEADQKVAAQSVNKYVIDEVWFNPMYRLEQHFYYTDSVDVQNQAAAPVPSIYNYKPSGK